MGGIAGGGEISKLSEDLADRVVEIRILKHPSTHAFFEWPEGDLISRVDHYQGFHPACIHTILREWVSAGRTVSPDVGGIRFKEWEAVPGDIFSMRPHDPLVLFPEGDLGRHRMTCTLSFPDGTRMPETHLTLTPEPSG